MEAAVAHYIERHRSLAAGLAGNDLDWLVRSRNEALASFEQTGFPSLRDEDWRYTSLRPVTSTLFEPGAVPAVSAGSEITAEKLGALRLVFVDGVFAADASDVDGTGDGIIIDTLSSVLRHRPELVRESLGTVRPQHGHGFIALNDAFSEEGAVVLLEPGAVLEQPLEVLHIGTGTDAMAQPRHLLVAAEGSRATLIEHYLSSGDARTLTNSVTELLLGANAEVDYYLFQEGANRASHISGTWARQHGGSRLGCRTITLGGGLVRNELRSDLVGEGAHCDMLGLYNIGGRQHVDNHTTMVHAAPDCTSRELYKGVLDQRSRAVFHGRIKVSPGAVGTDAEQANNNLLLSRDAEIDTKPQLEIYADDVKCAHGATVGQMDPDSLFYLRSRGIDKEEARAMLTFAFVNDVVSEVSVEALRTLLEQRLAERLINQPHPQG